MESETLIIGIDPGTNVTGYGIIRLLGNRMTPVDFGCIRPKSSLDHPKKTLAIFNAIDHLLEIHKPQAFAIETQYVHKNVQSAIKLAMAREAARLPASRRGIPTFEYTPTKAKRAVVGNGSAHKSQVQRMVQLLLQLPHPPEPEDAADALALAICHANTLKGVLCSRTSKAL